MHCESGFGFDIKDDFEKNRKGHSNMKNYRAELTGVFGDPVDDNPTGVVEEAAFAAKNLNYRYLTIKVLPEDLGKAMDSVKIFDMKGINLTMPHKIKVLPYLDELSPAAEIIGAVNTVIQKDGKLYGENTDGAARAIAVECALNGAAHINIINRSIEKGEELASLIQMKTGSSSKYLNWKKSMAIPSDTDILINATSIGFSPNVTDKPDIDYTTITPEMCVCDVIFNPAETIFLKSAAENGAKTITGLGMLVQQAALNFTLWTGVEAPVDVMEDALKKEFE